MRRGRERYFVLCAGVCASSILASTALAQTTDAPDKLKIELEEVVITGSRLRTGEEGAAPVTCSIVSASMRSVPRRWRKF